MTAPALTQSASRFTFPETATAIGLDIGGTKLAAAAFSAKSGLSEAAVVPTPKVGADFIAAIDGLIHPLLASDNPKPQCLGIASAGTVDSDAGKITGSTGNLPALKEIPDLVQQLQTRLGIPVFIENDANAAAYGEAKIGAGQGISNVLMITLGTGIGGGIIIQNQLYRGAQFCAAEVGHIAISTDKKRLCTCGRWDCWEAYGSGTGMGQTARLELQQSAQADYSVMLSSGKTIEQITTQDVIEAWKKGDEVAIKIRDHWHEHVALGLAGVINILDPQITVISGGMGKYVDYPRLTVLTQERTMRTPIKIVPATLENQAGMVGAAIIALEKFHA